MGQPDLDQPPLLLLSSVPTQPGILCMEQASDNPATAPVMGAENEDLLPCQVP